MKQEPCGAYVCGGRPTVPRPRIIRRAAPRSAGPRPPVKRRLFAVGGASQPGRVRLTVDAAASASARPRSPAPPAAGADDGPLVLRKQRPVRTFQRRRNPAARRQPQHELWLRVGGRQVQDFAIPMGHRQEVMASELCDLDTKQTVLVRSSCHEASAAGQGDIDCSGIDWQPPSYAQCYTPPGHGTQTLPQFPTSPAAPEPGGDHRRPPLPPPVSQPCRPDGDGSSLMWLLDYRLDHLLEPAQEDACRAPAAPARQQQRHRQPPRQQQQQHQQQLQQQQQQLQQQQLQQLQQQQQNQPQQQHQPQPLPEQVPEPLPEQLAHPLPETVPESENGMYLSCCHSGGRHWDGAEESKCVHDFKAAQAAKQGYYATTTTKPPFTYTELIEQAMLEEGELTVSGIYRWITSHFGFYKSCDDRWKNSVRHNLSMNPYFRKGDKAKNGTGHLWTLANVEGRRIRRNSVAARMGRPCRKCPQLVGDVELDLCDDMTCPANDIWLSSAAENKENMPICGEYTIEYLDFVPDQVAPPTAVTLEESADRILAGSNSQVEVQFITPVRSITQDTITLVDYQALDVPMHS